MKALRISPDLSLPADTVTATLVAYGGKGVIPEKGEIRPAEGVFR